MAATRISGGQTAAEEKEDTPVENTPAPAPSGPVAPKQSGEAYVKYVGYGSRRVLTSEDFKRVGAEGQKTAEWTMGNKFMISASEFTADALRYLKIDDGFEFVRV